MSYSLGGPTCLIFRSLMDIITCLVGAAVCAVTRWRDCSCLSLALSTLWRSNRHLPIDQRLCHHHHPRASLLPVGLCLPGCPWRGGPRSTVRTHSIDTMPHTSSVSYLTQWSCQVLTWTVDVVGTMLMIEMICLHFYNLFAVVASPCFCVWRGIEYCSNSGFRTPLITLTSAGDLTTMDCKVTWTHTLMEKNLFGLCVCLC